jgi:hypothetical protein
MPLIEGIFRPDISAMFDDRGPIDHSWFNLHVKNKVKLKE